MPKVHAGGVLDPVVGTLVDAVPVLTVAAVPKPKLVLAVVALGRSARLLASFRKRASAWPVVGILFDPVPVFNLAAVPNPKLDWAVIVLVRSERLLASSR